ncbi:MAG: hypothetical protein AAB857_02620 [Patescibacteria group bacterium]
MKLHKDSLKTAIILWVLGLVFGKTVGKINILGLIIGDIIVVMGWVVFVLWIIKLVRNKKN